MGLPSKAFKILSAALIPISVVVFKVWVPKCGMITENKHNKHFFFYKIPVLLTTIWQL